MIRILFVHKKMECGGVEKALYDLIMLLDKDTYDVTVLLQQEGGIWEQKFRDAGIKLTHIYDCQKGSSKPLVKAGNLLKRWALDIAWRRDGKGALAIALPSDYDLIVNFGVVVFDRLTFYKNTKTIKYIHGDAGTNQPYREYLERNRTLFTEFDRIICVSETARKSFEEITQVRDRVITRYNPLDSEHIRILAQEPVDLPKDLPLICAVGRLSPEKAFDRLVRIHKNLLDKGLRHRLVIVGDGPEREKIEEEIRRTGTEDSVILAGYQSNPYPYMKQSEFLVCSSYTEGLPVISMEALSLGIPIVSAVPAIGEIFGGQCCGIITDNDDASLEAGVEKMLRDPSFYKEATDGASKQSSFFEGKRMVSQVEEVFRNLAGENRS